MIDFCFYCRVIYGLVASQVGDFHNSMLLGSGSYSNPADFIYTQYGYRHDYLGKPSCVLSCSLHSKSVLEGKHLLAALTFFVQLSLKPYISTDAAYYPC